MAVLGLEKYILAEPKQRGLEPRLYQVEVIRSRESFELAYSAWEELLAASEIQNLSLTHSWLSTWLKYFKQPEMMLIIVKNSAGQWIGAAPFQVSQKKSGLGHRFLKVVQWIGTYPTVFDWMQFVIHPQVPEFEVIQAIAKALRQEEWDVIDLQFSGNQDHMVIFERALAISTSSHLTSAEPIPYIALPDTVEQYEKIRRKKTRLEVNRHRNHMVRALGQAPTLEFQSPAIATWESLYRFISGHIQYWAERGDVSLFKRFPSLFDFYRDMLVEAEDRKPHEAHLQFSILKVNEIELSYHLGFWQGNSYLAHVCSLNSQYKQYSPGTIHMDTLVYETIHQEGVSFELGNGDEPYKKLWAQNKRPLWQLTLPRTKVANALWNLDLSLLKLRDQGRCAMAHFKERFHSNADNPQTGNVQ